MIQMQDLLKKKIVKLTLLIKYTGSVDVYNRQVKTKLHDSLGKVYGDFMLCLSPLFLLLLYN